MEASCFQLVGFVVGLLMNSINTHKEGVGEAVHL